MQHRRGFLKAALSAPLVGLAGLSSGAGSARAMGLDAKVGIALLAHGVGHDSRPQAVEQLMWETSKRTSIDVRERPGLVDPEAAQRPLPPDLAADAGNLFRWPLVVWIGAGAAPPLSPAARARLERFLRAGGTLFIDDASPPGDDAFDASVRRELTALWKPAALARLDAEHTLFRSFFLLDRPYGRISRQSHLEGIEFDDRSAIIYSRNDLFGAFGRDSLGQWLLPVVPGGSVQREMAFRTGINLLMYATCLDYKRDQVHTTAILRRRKWRARTTD